MTAALPIAADHARYTTQSRLCEHVEVRVLCRLTEAVQARRDRLAAELEALDRQIAGEGS